MWFTLRTSEMTSDEIRFCCKSSCKLQKWHVSVGRRDVSVASFSLSCDPGGGWFVSYFRCLMMKIAGPNASLNFENCPLKSNKTDLCLLRPRPFFHRLCLLQFCSFLFLFLLLLFLHILCWWRGGRCHCFTITFRCLPLPLQSTEVTDQRSDSTGSSDQFSA